MHFRLARDPVFYTNLVAAAVTFISTFFVDLTVNQQGAVNALAVLIAGAVSAWKVSDGQLALAMGIFKGLIAVAVSFGLGWTPEQQLIILTLVQAIGAAFVRTQVGAPVPPPASTANPVTPVGGSPLPR